MRNFILCFVSDESGATAIEYGIIIGSICLVLVAALGGVTAAMNDNLGAIAAALQ